MSLISPPHNAKSCCLHHDYPIASLEEITCSPWQGIPSLHKSTVVASSASRQVIVGVLPAFGRVEVLTGGA